MLRFYSTLLILISYSVLASEPALELWEAVQISTSTLQQNNDPTHNLQTCLPERPQEEVVCASEVPDFDSSDYLTLLISYPSLKDLPSEIKKELPGEVLEGNTQGRVKLVVAFPNDNKLFGMWGIFTGLDKDGDDHGFTHGSSLSLSTSSKKGKTLKVEGGSNIFTKKISPSWTKDDGSRTAEVIFTNENFIKALADNIHAGKTLYWKAGAGWQQLDSKNWKSPFSGSGQQFRWHNLLQEKFDPKAAYDPIYKPDGKGVRDGITLEAFFGLQKNLVFGNGTCRIKTSVDLGGQYGTLGSSSVQMQVGTYFFFQKPGSKFSIMTGSSVNARGFKEGKNLTIEPVLNMGIGRFEMGFIYHQTYGALQNYAEYNLPNKEKNDSIMTFKMGFAIGRFRSK